jgi:argininosuccinate lyase
MWSGRFREPLDPFFDYWQRSIRFDRRILMEEARASKAHALALESAGVLTADECSQICAALQELMKAHALRSADTAGYKDAEDIHHFVELKLVESLGDLGLKLHTGRSRNEQIATDLRLFVRDRGSILLAFLGAWAKQLVEQAKAAGDAVMPSYTHLQRAEPVLVAHWLLAYVEMLLRDASRLEDCSTRLNY